MRLYNIVYDLLKQEDYCAIEFFMEKHNVSKRTIQNDISYLIRISLHNGFTIHNKRGVGYLLEVTNQEVFDPFIESLNEGVSFHTKERPKQILAFLTTQNGYVSMDKIADVFQISKTLVKIDMKDVEKIADIYNLTLERKSHYGTRILYDEKYLKNYLVDEYLRENIFIETAINDIVKDTAHIETEIIEQLNKEELNINYNELLEVTIYLKVMIYLSVVYDEKHGQKIAERANEKVQRIVLYLQETVENLYEIEFNSYSIELFYKKMIKNVREQKKESPFTEFLIEDINSFLLEIDDKYETHFLKNDDFKRLLMIHVSLLIDRLHNKISYKNSLVYELNITYPTIFNIALQFCEMLKQKYKVEVTFDEVGFVAMHFAAHMEREKQLKLKLYNRIGVVCSSGAGSAYMIKLQIESLFPTSIVETFSFLQQKELQIFNPDLIFTVMPLKYDIQVPVIYIKELLDDRDLYRIKQILQCTEHDPYILLHNNPLYLPFLSKDFFKIVKADNYDNLIMDMALELEEKGYGKKGFALQVMERESFVSTIYLNGVCIPHPIETDALDNIVSICMLEKPFLWKEKEVKIVFMICLSKDSIEIYKTMTKKLYQLMKEPKYLHKLIQVKSFEEFIAVLKEMGGLNNE